MFLLLTLVCQQQIISQQVDQILSPLIGDKIALSDGWYMKRADEVMIDGSRLTRAPYNINGWMPAKVPGTVLTSLIENNIYPDPGFGLNNNLIPDIYDVGNEFYTYWFVNSFNIKELAADKRLWLNFRGVNYKADVFLNGKRLNRNTHEGMFIRQSYDITEYVEVGASNILAVLVSPPDYPGNPNGGQGGDGQIARNVTMQFTPGWDWIQPVRDRNTGIWDEVCLETTGVVRLLHPYVVTKVPGIRNPNAAKQPDAIVKTSIQIENLSDKIIRGELICNTDGRIFSNRIVLNASESRLVDLSEIIIKNPRLWWPNGIGKQELYDMEIYFERDGEIDDVTKVRYGIREITSDKCPDNGGRRFFVNGQKIYMPGGNYIASDWLLRLSPERYRAEVKFHAEMNLRMIRVWGGALVERPEFYDACDEYGILVFQDLWGTGDCNGAWEDIMKKDSRERRWDYPDNHNLFVASVEDQVKMIRNHPSLCLWCGGNEWPLAKDIDDRLKNEVFPKLDSERLFISYSTDSVFTRNLLGDNGDGPYGIQELEWFFTFRSHPFNPEAGSVGSPEVESMREIMSEIDLNEHPKNGSTRNYSWRYHKDLGYRDHLERYGDVTDIETYSKYAQVVNYDQYRSFMEGWASHMWDWYTGILIWKTQNPWTSLRGQMYDWFLDVNASFYGVKKGCEPLHPFYNLATQRVNFMNSTVDDYKDIEVVAQLFDINGNIIFENKDITFIEANSIIDMFAIPTPEGVNGVYFLKLQMSDSNNKKYLSNIYWLTTTPKDYSMLHNLPSSDLNVKYELMQNENDYTAMVELKTDSNISFFNRIKVFDKVSGKRILPVHYSDNYITLMPNDSEIINIQFHSTLPKEQIEIRVDGWNNVD